MLYRRDFTREKLNHSQTPLLCRILGGDRGRVGVLLGEAPRYACGCNAD